jgi:hypothetical protein
MRRIFGIVLAGGLGVFAGLLPAASRAQDPTAGDLVGYGPKGVSNSFGYGVRSRIGQGYYTGLYRPFDNTSESVAYNPAFNGVLGAPSPAVASRPWKFSPPWSANYRQGHAKGRGLLGRHKNRAEVE